MSKREYILLIAMLISLVFAGLYYAQDSLLPSATHTPLDLESLNQEVLLLSQTISQNELPERKRYILENAALSNAYSPLVPKAWLENLNLDELYASDNIADENGEILLDIEYSGYIKSNGSYYAFLDNLEYTVGDRLDTHPYVVTQITPEAVLIQSIQTKRIQEIPRLGEILSPKR